MDGNDSKTPVVCSLEVKYDRFIDFITAKPLRGLGTNQKMLERICSDDIGVRDLITQATQNAVGPPEGNKNASKTTDNNVNSRSKRSSPVGNNSQQALRKLRKYRPDLHAEVLAGKLSLHAAKQKGRSPESLALLFLTRLAIT